MVGEVFSSGKIILTVFAGLIPVKERNAHRAVFAGFDSAFEEGTETLPIPIRSEPHNLVFVRVEIKPEMQSDDRVEDTDRISDWHLA